MINGVRFKVCGLTSPADAELAGRAGADYLGFNLYAKSPRSVTLEQYRAMALRLHGGRKVAVIVEPTLAEMREIAATGFDFIQVHFDANVFPSGAAAWAAEAGSQRLWLAPRLPPESDIPPAVLALANTFLIDAFVADKFGGSGKTADWTKFRRHREAMPENISIALKVTGARIVDVNSGIEASPGVKDPARLAALVASLAESRA
jgi:phosphoribosylanthranilate isomerase